MGPHWEGTSGPSPSAQLSYRLRSGDWTSARTLQRERGRLPRSVNPLPSALIFDEPRRPQPLLRILPHPIPRPQKWQSELIGFGARETEVAATVGGGPGGRAAACRAPSLSAPATACISERMADRGRGRGRRWLISVRPRYGHRTQWRSQEKIGAWASNKLRKKNENRNQIF
jgi:hypothetical protein